MSQAEKLIADLIENLHEVERTKHVGRIKRLFSARDRIFAAIDAEQDATGALYGLLSHPDEQARAGSDATTYSVVSMWKRVSLSCRSWPNAMIS